MTAQIFTRWPEIELARTPLGTAPTSVRPLRLPGLGEDVWCKAENEFGHGAWAGNKVRKLEWIIGEAQRQGVRTIFTVGGIGTHWGLACARYGAEHGIRTVLGLVDQPVDDHVREQYARLQASSARIYRFATTTRLKVAAPLIIARNSLGGRCIRPPWYVPAGGSNPFGTLGYVETALEIAAQVEAGEMPAPGTVVVPVGSGGTVAGLVLGFKIAGLETKVFGAVVNDSLPLDAETLVALANETGELLRERGATDIPTITLSDLEVRDDWLGQTYGDPTPASVAMVAAAAEQSMELEPVYTGKALAAIADLRESLAGPVLWLNTHGPR